MNRIELLSERLIDENPDLAMEVLAQSSRLSIPLGWHYLLDLIWLLRELDGKHCLRILEIGAGMGLLQFILADRGHEVISADMRVRTPPVGLRSAFRFEEFGSAGRIEHRYLRHHGLAVEPERATFWGKLLDLRLRDVVRLKPSLRREATNRSAGAKPKRDMPTIHVYRCNATCMDVLEDASIDATLSVSALEHNQVELVRQIGCEVDRVTKPGGIILHTVSACNSGTRFHEASHSHLFGERELAELYGLPDFSSNFDQYDQIEKQMKASPRLRKWLALYYFQTSRSGMPWGLWAPEYLPVGVARRR